MRRDLLGRLCCPACQGLLELGLAEESPLGIERGELSCTQCSHVYPIVGHIPRFVPPNRYGGSFGLQWNKFRRTQLDTFSKTQISRDRFLAQTGWTREVLAEAWVLDAGCGAGRFAEVALSLGARVVAVDASSAVDACWSNLNDQQALDVVQADLYALPFRKGSFDCVYSLGVLQHTPDVKRAFQALPAQLRPGGRLAADIYQRSWKSWVHPKYVLRPLSSRLNPETLLRLTERFVPPLLAASSALSRLPLIGGYLRHLVPVANYEGVYPLTKDQLREWAILDTYDWLAPQWDSPQTADELRLWIEEAGLEHSEVIVAYHLTVRARRRLNDGPGGHADRH